MTEVIHFTPLFHRQPVLKGFLAGALLVAGILSGLGLGVQAVLVLLGIFMFIDAIIPDGPISIVASVLAAFGGAVVSGLFQAAGLSLPWTVLLVIGFIASMALRFRRKKMPENPTPPADGLTAVFTPIRQSS